MKLDHIKEYARMIDIARDSDVVNKQFLVEQLGISMPTINEHARKLIDQGILRSDSTNGTISLNKNYCCFWGISVGSVYIKISVIDFSFSPIMHKNIFQNLQNATLFVDERFEFGSVKNNIICIKTPATLNELISILNLIMQTLICTNERAKDENDFLPIAGIGFAFSGIVDHESYAIEYSSNISYLQNVNLQTMIYAPSLSYCAENGIMLTFENNANAAVIAEKYALRKREDIDSRCKNAKNIACLYLGTGLGLGLVLDNALYKGMEFAGEIGHIPIALDAKLLNPSLFSQLSCSCGNSLCLESYINSLILDTERSNIDHNTDNLRCSLAKKAECTRDLASAISFLLNIITLLLNVDIVILAGRLIEAFKDPNIDLWNQVNQKQVETRFRHISKKYSLIQSKYGAETSAIGAAIESYFDAIKHKVRW